MKTNIENATPLPWHISQYKNGFNFEICSDNGTVCTVLGTSGTQQETQANASLIVESVNQHAALVAVKEAAESVSRVLETYKEAHGSWQQINYQTLIKALAALEAIRKEGK